MNEKEVFFNAIGSGLGGFIGVILFFGIRTIVGYCKSKPKYITEYFVANEINIGQERESYGEIMHGYGKRITEENELRKYNFNNPVWEWIKNNDNPPILFYGPYTTDLAEPGKYKIRFKIKGIGFSNPKEIIKNHILFEIDVLESIQRTELDQTRSPGISWLPSTKSFAERNIIGKKYLRVSDLVNTKDNYFDVIVNSNGKGIWEYRASAYDGSGGKHDNLSEFGNSIRVFFEKVEVFKIKDFEFPWN